MESEHNIINGILSNIYERFVVKKHYNFDNYLKQYFKNFVTCLKLHNYYQKNYFTKNMIDRIINNLNNICKYEC